MVTKNFFLLSFILSSFTIKAQEDVSIINSSGFNLQSSNLIFDISIGEPFISTLQDTSQFYSCGYLQPFTAVNSIHLPEKTDVKISVFPNPFTRFLYIEVLSEFYTYEIYDLMGKLVFEGKVTHTIDLNTLVSGIYSITLFDQNRHVISNIKVCKLNE